MFPMGLDTHIRTTQRRRVSTSVSSWTTWSPLALQPYAWFDASDTSTITSSSGLVSQWTDKSAYGRNATQGTSSLQPTTGVDTRNGLNVLTFTNHMLLTSTFSFSQPVTIFAVAARSSTDTVNRQLVGNESTTPTIYTDSNQWNIFAGSVLASTTSSANTNWQYFTATFNGLSSVLRRNRTQIVSGAAGSNGYSTKAINVGGPAGFRWQGLVAELIFVPGIVESRNIEVVENYLSTKWAI